MINRPLTIAAQTAFAIIFLGEGWNDAAAQHLRDPQLAPLPEAVSSLPLTDLLPAPPKAKTQRPSAFVNNLAEVPELMLTEPMPKERDPRKTINALASQITKIAHLNKEKPDGFVELLVAERPDLAGLPFRMGNTCRQSTTQSRYFKKAAALVHGARTSSSTVATEDGRAFLARFTIGCLDDDDSTPGIRRKVEQE